MNKDVDLTLECKRIFQNAVRLSDQLKELQTDNDFRPGAAIAAASLGSVQTNPKAEDLPQDAKSDSCNGIRAITAKVAAAVLRNTERLAGRLEALTRPRTGPLNNAAATSGHASQDSRWRSRWTHEEIAVVVAHAKGLKPHGPQHIDILLENLGWDQNSAKRARFKLILVRRILERGGDPFSGRHVSGTRRNTCNWRGWLEAAFAARPDNEATADEIAACLVADPVISPKLDRRIEATTKTVPMWKKTIRQKLALLPGFTNTGRKRNGRVIYRYEPHGVDLTEEGEMKQSARKRGRKGVLRNVD